MQVSTSLSPELWVDLYADSLFRYVVSRIPDKQAAEDIVQETFLSAWKSRGRYDSSTSEKNWLFAICKNKMIDHYRKNMSRITFVITNEEDHYFDHADHWTPESQPSVWPVDYLQPVDKKDFQHTLDQCRGKLKEIPQMVFSMKYIDDLKPAEVCRILKISMTNYWVMLHRAKLQLRACLEKNWIGI